MVGARKGTRCPGKSDSSALTVYYDNRNHVLKNSALLKFPLLSVSVMIDIVLIIDDETKI